MRSDGREPSDSYPSSSAMGDEARAGVAAQASAGAAAGGDVVAGAGLDEDVGAGIEAPAAALTMALKCVRGTCIADALIIAAVS